MCALAMETFNRGGRSRTETTQEQVLVVGVGNLLIGDEGVGVHVVQELRRRSWPEHVTLVASATGGVHLLELLQSAPRVILIDATRDGLWPGSVSHFHVVEPSDFPPALGDHDIGMKALLTAAALVDELPAIEVITISIDETKSFDEELSQDVAAALPEVERLVRRLVE